MLHQQTRNPQRPALAQTLEQVCRVLPLPGRPIPPFRPTAYRVRVLDRGRITTVPIPGGDSVCALKIGAQEAGFTVWRRGCGLFVLPHGEMPA